MEASAGHPPHPPSSTDPLTEKIKKRLLKKGVIDPTPKIIRALRKKHHLKTLRKSKRLATQSQTEPLSESQIQTLAEELHFKTIAREFKEFNEIQKAKSKIPAPKMVGRPWERLERSKLGELSTGSKEYRGETLNSEHLRELGEIFEGRKREAFSFLLNDDIDLEDGMLSKGSGSGSPTLRRRGDAEAIRFLVDKLSVSKITLKDWKFRRMMKQGGLHFTEGQLLKILRGLGDRGSWRQAMDVVEWVYSNKEYRNYKSRFVYTKLLAVLGKARRPQEALQIFKLMRGDCHIYPDMAAYHSIAVTLGQAGLLKELVNIIESMKQKPSRRIKNVHLRNWDPILRPDVVVFNSVLNACVPSKQWKGVSWVFEQLRKGGLKPNNATYGLAMEVMLYSGKYGLVHELFQKMRKNGEAPKALTYKIIVRTFWKEGKIDEAIDAVRDMERRGIIGTASVYYELACCLCNQGRWQEAMIEIEKLKKLPHSKPLEVAFTGMILSSMNSGHVNACKSIFEHMKGHCSPNIGTINAMLEVYGRSDMFSEAKELFENIKRLEFGWGISSEKCNASVIPDVYTYGLMLKASAQAHQWEYFEFVYKEMSLLGYQCDQGKHAPLLVEASRAGKGHLLEHAFDTILEAGGIPHPLLFTEMVCQATAHKNYERASEIVNAMAQAPFRVSEEEWKSLFKKNRARISSDHLKNLLDVLQSSNVAEEANISNLLRSLLSLSRSDLSKSISATQISSQASQIEENSPSGELDYTILLQSDDSHDIHEEEDEDGDDDFDTFRFHLSGGDDVVSDRFNDHSDSKLEHSFDCEEMENAVDKWQQFHPQTIVAPDSRESELPSADEILKAWKERGKRDGVIFPFHPR